jgi:hypothetical protein
MKYKIPHNQFLAEVNNDLGVPLHFKMALHEFHKQACVAVWEHNQARERVKLLWEAKAAPAAATPAAAKPAADLYCKI